MNAFLLKHELTTCQTADAQYKDDDLPWMHGLLLVCKNEQRHLLLCPLILATRVKRRWRVSTVHVEVDVALASDRSFALLRCEQFHRERAKSTNGEARG